MTWDRSKQNYWISRSGNPWRVISEKTKRAIADYPAGLYDNDLIEKICMAENDLQVQTLIQGSVAHAS